MYGGTLNYDSSSCSYQLQEYNRIEEEADRRTSRWKKIWDKLDPPQIAKKVQYTCTGRAALSNLSFTATEC